MALTTTPQRTNTTNCDVVSYNPDGSVNSSYQVLWIRETESFTVTPSPCHNGTNRKLPGEYSYSGDKWRRPFGRVDQYYWGGNIGNRKLYRTSYIGNLQGFGLDNIGWDDPIGWQIERTNARNRCLSKLYDKIKQSEVNLSTTIGEGRETLQMMSAIGSKIKSPIGSLSEQLRKHRRNLKADHRRILDKYFGTRGQRGEEAALDSQAAMVLAQEVRAATGTLKTVSGAWLGWAVGLKPLLHDLEELGVHLQSSDSLDVRYHQYARATARQHYGSNGWSIDDSEWYQIGVTYKITDMHLFENWRLGLTVRPTLAWELTRLSLVVDYFIGLGSFLESFEAACFNNGMLFEGGYQTISRRKVGSFSWKRANENASDAGSVNGATIHFNGDGWASGLRSHIHKERFRLSSFPIQALPTLKLPKVAEQLFTLSALLSLFFLSRSK